jgi:hypothetical protein
MTGGTFESAVPPVAGPMRDVSAVAWFAQLGLARTSSAAPAV